MDARKVWTNEALDFTPWLAKPENLQQLGEALEIELEVEAQEHSVGPFRADILCKQVGTNHWVLVENQLERTDHTHLGQLLTYAAGLDAVSIIWVSTQFTEEHRATLDWLNRITDDIVNFFGVELEILRIGESDPAPRFNVISRPNQWSKTVAAAGNSWASGETAQTHLAYWTAFKEALSERDSTLRAPKPIPQNWVGLSPFNRIGFSISTATNKEKNRLSVDLYIGGKSADGFFRALLPMKEAIEAQLGPLVWHDGAVQDRRVIKYLEDANPTVREDWPRQHRWIADNMEAFTRVFSPIVPTLSPAPPEGESYGAP